MVELLETVSGDGRGCWWSRGRSKLVLENWRRWDAQFEGLEYPGVAAGALRDDMNLVH